MKASLISLWLVLLLSVQGFGQELYGDQSWELVGDQNTNGWVDPGDTVAINLEVSFHDVEEVSITIQNSFVDPNFELINGTVATTVGVIQKGNVLGDDQISITDVHLEAPWGYASVKFRAIVSPNKMELSSVSNELLLLAPFGATKSNRIDIGRNSQIVEASNSNIGGSNLTLILFLIGGMILGIIYKQMFVPKLSY